MPGRRSSPPHRPVAGEHLTSLTGRSPSRTAVGELQSRSLSVRSVMLWRPSDPEVADGAERRLRARSLSGALPTSMARDGPLWRGFGLRLGRPARVGGSRVVAWARAARVLFRSHDAPRHARNPDLAVLLERAHFAMACARIRSRAGSPTC